NTSQKCTVISPSDFKNLEVQLISMNFMFPLSIYIGSKLYTQTSSPINEKRRSLHNSSSSKTVLASHWEGMTKWASKEPFNGVTLDINPYREILFRNEIICKSLCNHDRPTTQSKADAYIQIKDGLCPKHRFQDDGLKEQISKNKKKFA
ncbi:20822_t:CDS:2, partial [Gigaspora rosea]